MPTPNNDVYLRRILKRVGMSGWQIGLDSKGGVHAGHFGERCMKPFQKVNFRNGLMKTETMFSDQLYTPCLPADTGVPITVFENIVIYRLCACSPTRSEDQSLKRQCAHYQCTNYYQRERFIPENTDKRCILTLMRNVIVKGITSNQHSQSLKEDLEKI